MKNRFRCEFAVRGGMIHEPTYWECAMLEHVQYKHLRPKRGSNYEKLAVNGRIRAEIIYRETLGPDPLSPEQVAKEYGVPVEAVLEAIDYCEHNRALLDAESAREQFTVEERGLNEWPHAPRYRTGREACPT